MKKIDLDDYNIICFECIEADEPKMKCTSYDDKNNCFRYECKACGNVVLIEKKGWLSP